MHMEPAANVPLGASTTSVGGKSGSFIRAQEQAQEQPLTLHAGSFGGVRSDAANIAPDPVYGEQAKIASTSFTDELDLNGNIPGADLPQLTVKSVVAGVCAGAFGSILAIYYGLKTGITPSLNIISSLLGYVFVKCFMSVSGSSGKFTVQENAVIQTTAVAVIAVASSTGFSSGLLAMTPNAAKATGELPGNDLNDVVSLTWPRSVAFACAVAFFGFFIAFPMREYCILQRKLTFPSGTATAAVITTMHANGEEAMANFWVLAKTTVFSTFFRLFVWAFDGLDSFPMFGIPLANYGFTIDWDLGTFAIGLLLSPMINFAIMLGGVVGWGIMWPMLDAHHRCTALPDGTQPATQDGKNCWYYEANDDGAGGSPHYLDGMAYTLFPAIMMVVVDAVYSIIKLSIVVAQGFMQKGGAEEEDEEETEASRARKEKLNEIFRSYKIPLGVHAVAYLCCAVLCIVITSTVFGVNWYEGLVAILLTPIFATGIIVGIGMTDWDVSSSFGKLMMLPMGAWNHGGSVIPSLAVCMMTISGCGAAGGLMQDFKTGYLVGASPKAMFYSQVIGAFCGCLIAPSIFSLFEAAFTIPTTNTTAFISGKYGFIYRTLACVCTAQGLSSLPPNCTTFMFIFGGIGLALNILIDVLKKVAPNAAQYVPNPMAFSIGLLIGPSAGIEFMVGSIIFEIWRMREKETANRLGNIIASGCLAGSGIAVIIQIAMSLANARPPIHISYSDNMGHDM